jgi:hypothetical protein
MSDTVLDRATAADVIAQPFPHVVIRDALPPDRAARLMAHMPPFERVLTGRENLRGPQPENTRVHYLGQELLADDAVSPVWKEFVRAHSSPAFLARLLDVFDGHIRSLHPALERRFGDLTRIKAGLRHVDDHARAELLLDALLVFNTPVVSRPTSVRRAHLDSPHKLFTGLLYLRDPQDHSLGGDLELCRFTPGGPRGFDGPQIDSACVTPVKTIAYDSNVLVMFLNSVESVHGVTVRHPTPHRRCYVSLVGEFQQPLFDLAPYQMARHRRALRRVVTLAERALRKAHRVVRAVLAQVHSPDHSAR